MATRFVSFAFGTSVALSSATFSIACTGPVDPNPGSGGDVGGASIGGIFGSGGAGAGGLGAGGVAPFGGTSSGGNIGSGGANTGASPNGGAATSGGASGGGESVGGAAGYPPTFATIRRIVANSLDVAEGCGSGSCHNGEATPHFTDNEELYSILVQPSPVLEYCGDMPLVTPGDPSKSAFLKVIRDGCPEIERMPRGCDPDPLYGNCLPAAAISAVEAWIAAGAPAE
jgi:hypothetical protein